MNLLTNEERLRRKRERWGRQTAERKKPGSEFKVLALVKGRAHQRRSGIRERGEMIISAYAMQIAERIFWRKRGFDSPPVTAAGVMR